MTNANRHTPSRQRSALWVAAAVVLAILAFAAESNFLTGTRDAGAAPATVNLWGSTTPRNPETPDSGSVELGTRFTSEVAGNVTGVRFYKSRSNMGTHVGNLWDASGKRLASVTFRNETSSGWQSASFSQPVAINANTSYVISYFAPRGRYAGDSGYFTGKGRDRSPLHAPASTTTRKNGVYRYGSSSAFPTSSYKDTNYYVDVVFAPKAAPAPTTTAPAPTTTAPAPTTTAPAPTTTAPAPTTTAPAPTTTTTRPPSSSAWPDASNTGVPSGYPLKPSGGFTVTQAGAVIDGLDVSGCIVVQADNVTIRNSRVRGSCSSGTITSTSNTNLVIEDVEVDGLNRDGYSALVSTSNFTCRRCNLHSGGQGFHAEFNVVVEDSYVHDIFGQNDSHNDSFVSNGGNNMVIRHNTMLCEIIEPDPQGGCSAAIAIYGDFHPVDNVLVENNLLGGGSFCAYGGSVDGKRYPVASNVRFVGNHFTNRFYPKCGEFGPITAFKNNVNGNSWTGNVWHESGAPIGA
jgi:hypothetical protein